MFAVAPARTSIVSQSPGAGLLALPSPFVSPPTLSSFTDVKAARLVAEAFTAREPLTLAKFESFTTAPAWIVTPDIAEPLNTYGISVTPGRLPTGRRTA